MASAQKSTLEEGVAKRLATEGYRLEYQALKAMRDVGLNAYLGNYIKTAQGKPREIDVTAVQIQDKHNRHRVIAR